MRNFRVRSLPFLGLLLLPPAAQAELTPIGAPLAIADESPCSFITDLEVTATPKGAFEVAWVDDFEFQVSGRRFDRALNPGGPPVSLLPLHGGLVFFDIYGTWAANRYELAMNVVDFGTDPNDPTAAYRVSLDLNGAPVAPPARMKPQRFVELAPAAGGDSLQFRYEPPAFGPPRCRGLGLLARRVDESGAPLSPDSRVTRRAPSWSLSHLAVDRLPNDTFVAAYSTCQNYLGLVARRLNPNGAPVGKAVNLPMPGRVGNFGGGDLALAAHSGNDFAVAAMISTSNPANNGGYTRGVVNGKVFGPTRIPTPASVTGVSGVVDLEPSPAGGYLLLFQGAAGDPQRLVLFAQELDAQGVPQGTAVQLTENDELGVHGAVAGLPDGRWIVVTRAQHTEAEVCTERVVGTVLGGS